MIATLDFFNARSLEFCSLRYVDKESPAFVSLVATSGHDDSPVNKSFVPPPLHFTFPPSETNHFFPFR